jgi:hypothetical protein
MEAITMQIVFRLTDALRHPSLSQQPESAGIGITEGYPTATESEGTAANGIARLGAWLSFPLL